MVIPDLCRQTQDGLPENTVQAFAQTPNHYLWMGTSGGLLHLDGARFVLHDREKTPEIHENSIFSLTITCDGSVWASTDGDGLIRYKNGVFRTYSATGGRAVELYLCWEINRELYGFAKVRQSAARKPT